MLTRGGGMVPTIKIIDKRLARRVKVAAYCRVSTSDADQLASLDNQKKHYEDYISANPEWEFVGVYSDDGISGRSINRRMGFQGMVCDALEGKIDLILTKSISRFARNTVDCLKTARQLAAKGIYIRFEQDNIDTRNMDTELYMSIVSALAENESRSMSENIKWGIQKRFQDGTFKLVSPPYGYKYNEGNIEIDEEKAAIVRQIFSWGLEGMGSYTIARLLNEEGIPSPRGSKWCSSTINKLQRNIFYTGDVIFQSTYIGPDGKRHRNSNNVDAYYCAEHHDAIIATDAFEKLQRVMSMREKGPENKAKFKNRYVYSGKVFCGKCLSTLKHKIQHTGDKEYPLLACPRHISDKDKCSQKAVKEAAFKDAFCTMINKLICVRNRVLKPLLQEMENTSPPVNSNAEAELDKLDTQEKMLLEMQKQHGISSAIILPELQKINEARIKFTAVQAVVNPISRVNALKELISICDSTEPLEAFSDDIFSASVNKAIILSKKEIVFELKCGLKLKERLVRA